MKVISSIAVVLATTSSCTNAFAPSTPLVAKGPIASADSSYSLSMGLKVGDSFPVAALKKLGASGKKSVIYFYGADDAPSCKKQNSAFNSELSSFKSAGVNVIGVRNEKGVKDTDGLLQNLVVDENDEIRNELGIEKDFFILGGRETYVVGKDGTVGYVFNSQFKPNDHVSNALDYVESTIEEKKSGGFQLPDLASLFSK